MNIARPQGATMKGNYVDGVSLTYGCPSNHIWTFTASIDSRTGICEVCSRNKLGLMEEVSVLAMRDLV